MRNKMEREEQSSSLNQPLTQPICEGNSERSTEEERDIGRREIVEEVKQQLWLAGPLICTSVLQYSRMMISIMFVGHLGELSLAGASMATSFAVVSGFSLLVSSSFSSPPLFLHLTLLFSCIPFTVIILY